MSHIDQWSVALCFGVKNITPSLSPLPQRRFGECDIATKLLSRDNRASIWMWHIPVGAVVFIRPPILSLWAGSLVACVTLATKPARSQPQVTSTLECFHFKTHDFCCVYTYRPHYFSILYFISETFGNTANPLQFEISRIAFWLLEMMMQTPMFTFWLVLINRSVSFLDPSRLCYTSREEKLSLDYQWLIQRG